MLAFVNTTLETDQRLLLMISIAVSAAELTLTPCAEANRRIAWLVARPEGWLLVVDAGPGFAMMFLQKC
jgi:hypothetical protein